MRKIFSAALALVCIWFASPALAACNLFDSSVFNTDVGDEITFKQYQLPNGTYTMSTNFPPQTGSRYTNVWIIAGKQTTGQSSDINGVSSDYPRTITVTDGWYTIFYRSTTASIPRNPKDYNWQLERGSTATPYQPYNATCDDRCKNLFDSTGVTDNYFISPNGTVSAYARFGYTQLIPAEQNTSYTLSGINGYGGSTRRIHAYNNNGEWIAQIAAINLEDESEPYSVTGITPTNTAYIRVSYAISDTNVQLEQGDTATAYVPYNAACHNNKIKIATTKYNESAFSPLNAALANAISVVDTVVSNTITQAGRIATLQAQKQTRPNDIADDNEKCPAGKKCLLVEDASGIPHWYEIVERYSRLPDGYTELEYLTSGTDGQYIDTGILFDPTKNFRVVGNFINPYATLRKVILGNYYSQQSETYYSIELYTDGKFRNYMSADGGSAFNIYSPTAVPADTMAYFDTSYNALAHQTTTTLRYGTTEQTYSGATPETTTVAVHTLKLFNDKRNLSPVYNNPVSIGAVQIYIDDILAHHYVPARRESDNVLGMYDLADQNPATAFYTNAGEGSFIAGAPVSE